MGMPNAFSAKRGGFLRHGRPQMHRDDPACLSDYRTCFTRRFVSVDEKGTEASPLPLLYCNGLRHSRPEPQPVVIDQPFIFLIRDIETGAIIFVGRVVDPSA